MPPAPSLSTSSTSCAHDLGPGTKVCLRCRQEQRDAVRTRQQQMLGVIGVAAMGVFGLYVIGASAAGAWHAAARPDTSKVVARASVIASSVNGGSEVKQQGMPVSTAAAAPSPAPTTPAPAPVGLAATISEHPVVPILVSEGRTDLTETLTADRTGDSLMVNFDAPATRTRRRDKFEAVVRQTLPMIYGAPVDSVLRTIPNGEIVGDVDLLKELPKRGIQLPLGDGSTLELWPETRPGQDGPLVVSYWARVRR